MFNCLTFNVSEAVAAVTTTDLQTCQDILYYVNRSACSQSITNDFGYNFPYVIGGGCGYDYYHMFINATESIDQSTIPQCIRDILSNACKLVLNSPQERAVGVEILEVVVGFLAAGLAVYGYRHRDAIRDRCARHWENEENQALAPTSENKGCLQKAAGLIGNCWAGLWGRTTSEIPSDRPANYGSIQAQTSQDEGNIKLQV